MDSSNSPSGPVEPTAETLLREAACDAIRAGRMPAHAASRIWGGSGTGNGCPVCQKRIDENQFEIEMEFAPSGYQWRILHVHVQCCSAWEWARKTFPGGQAPHARVPEAAPSGADNTLRAPAREGSIDGRECHPQDRRGPAR